MQKIVTDSIVLSDLELNLIFNSKKSMELLGIIETKLWNMQKRHYKTGTDQASGLDMFDINLKFFVE